MNLEPLKPEKLYHRCDPEGFSFKTTEDLENLADFIGQPRTVAEGMRRSLAAIARQRGLDWDFQTRQGPVARELIAAASAAGTAATRLGSDTIVNLASTGVVVSRVAPDSKADEAGFVRGDLILEINRKEVRTVDELKVEIAGLESGQEVRFLIRRPRAGLNVITLRW